MHKLRPFLWIGLCVFALIIVAALIVHIFFIPPKNISYLNVPSEVSYSGYHPGNNRQQAQVWLGCYNQRLYYFGAGKDNSDNTKYDDSLCVFQGGQLVKVAQLAPKKAAITIVGIVDSFIYYQVNDTGLYDAQKLYCFNLENNERTLLFDGHLYLSSATYFADDGSVYVPLFPENNKEPQFVHVVGQDFLGVKPLSVGYLLGDSTYFVQKEYGDTVENLSKISADSNLTLEEIPLESANNRSVIPYEDGLLVHNKGYNSLLYQLNTDSGVTELFDIPCMASISTVNIHKTDAYISVMRYEKYGEKGMLRYSNDTMEGTYKISLIDGSVEKINEMCLDGIYNFDDTCFYCSDREGNIYQMEFDGTLNSILLLSE